MKPLDQKEVLEALLAMGESKASYPFYKSFSLAIMAGAFISVGALLSIVVGYGFPEASLGNPSLQKLLSAITFPIGLVMITLMSAELFTGNNASYMASMWQGRISPSRVAAKWAIVYLGNFIGAVTFAYFFAHVSGVVSPEPWHSAVKEIGQLKCNLDWSTAFVRAVGANWLVCLAVYLAISVRGGAAKFIALWFPIMCFVALGFEHSIANMFFIPLAMFEGADITFSQFIFSNLIPVTLGNIVGGALLVGSVHWYIFRK